VKERTMKQATRKSTGRALGTTAAEDSEARWVLATDAAVEIEALVNPLLDDTTEGPEGCVQRVMLRRILTLSSVIMSACGDDAESLANIESAIRGETCRAALSLTDDHRGKWIPGSHFPTPK
jgi:hypothetical protein